MKRSVGLAAHAALLVLLCPAAAQTPAERSDSAPPQSLIQDLVAANRILYHQGIVDGYGHVSVRHPARPDRFLISQAKAPGRVTADDIMEFDLDGNAVDRRGRPIYQERFIHSEIYLARADVNAVVHSHSPTIAAIRSSLLTTR
jgi:ribulose-5-phosphate 4-epimerase/fuculose-1-phosphate aldolase